jgi:hypothetical protein
MTFDWTQQAIELLNQLLDLLLKIINAWDLFNGPNGDVGYFSSKTSPWNNPGCRTHFSLRAIHEKFRQLEGLRQTLLQLEKSCRQSAEAVSMTDQ